MEEDVEWGYYCALRVSSVRLVVLLLGIDCFMIVGEGGRGCCWRYKNEEGKNGGEGE